MSYQIHTYRRLNVNSIVSDNAVIPTPGTPSPSQFYSKGKHVPVLASLGRYSCGLFSACPPCSSPTLLHP